LIGRTTREERGARRLEGFSLKLPLSALLSLLLVLHLAGCYAYVPLAASAAPKVGERVRVSLTPTGMTELTQYLGPRVAAAEGYLSSVGSDGTMVVAVDFVQFVDGTRQPWSGEGTISILPAHIAEVRERTFQKRQTILAASAATGALIAAAIIALKVGGAGGDPGGGGPSPPP
jgi:hypothetical protein